MQGSEADTASHVGSLISAEDPDSEDEAWAKMVRESNNEDMSTTSMLNGR